jgi:hypothetical protein
MAAVFLVLVVLGAIAIATIATALSVRRHFDEGRRLLVSAQASLLAGKIDRAVADFDSARRSFRQAEHEPGAVLLRLEGLAPFLGRTPRALVSLSRVGTQVSTAGTDVARALAKLPDGLSSLGLEKGRIPLDSLRSLAPSVHGARAALDVAAGDAARLPDSWVIGPVANARDLVRKRLSEATRLARSADALLTSLPTFAGEGREARYFVAAQNSAELRGTGGLIGNYAILTIRDGLMNLGPFHDVQDLPNLPPDKAPAPSKDFTKLYGAFGGGGFWLNINMTPDAATAGTAIEQLYGRVTGQRLDGTIFFDLAGLSDLLRATGPVKSKLLGFTFTADNVVRYVATAGYLKAPIDHPFEQGPRLVADAVWDRFFFAEPEKALRALIGAAANGHLVLHGTDPGLETAFRLAGVSGGFGTRTGDFFGVVHSNAAGNKVDFFLRQGLGYDVRLGPNGTAQALATATIRNTVPKGVRPGYAYGPLKGLLVDGRPLEPGEDRTWTQFYCGRGCRLVTSKLDGTNLGLEARREFGLPAYASFLEVKPSQGRRIELGLQLDDAWQGDRAGGTYRLRIQGQPSLPTTATVTIRVPEGMGVAWTSVPMRVEGGVATWRGSLQGSKDLEVRFQRGFFGRVWVRMWSFLSKPVIHLRKPESSP